MAKEPPVALDFFGVERGFFSDRRNEEERNAERSPTLSKPTASFACLENKNVPAVAMSLRTRESSSLALKRIFDQINSNAEISQHGSYDSAVARTVPFSEGKEEEGRYRGQASASGERAQDLSLGRSLEERPEAGSSQPIKGLYCAGSSSKLQEGRTLLSLKSFVDLGSDEDGRKDSSLRSSPHLPIDFSVTRHPDSSMEKERRFGFQISERPASPPLPIGGSISFKSVAETDRNAPIAQSELVKGEPSGGPQLATLEHLRNRLPDLDLSFRKAQIQDPALFLSSQTAFGSPISNPSLAAHQSSTAGNALLPQSPWPVHGLLPAQGLSSQAVPGTAIRPGVFSGRQPTAPLTIFYSGMVNVYDDVPADRAHAIMLLAGSGSGSSWSSHIVSSPSQPGNSTPAPLQASSGALAATVASTATVSAATTTKAAASAAPAVSMGTSTTSIPVVSTPVSVVTLSTPPAEPKQPPAKRCHAELPHARKASLARFLEKRKDRVVQAKAFTDSPGDKSNDTQDTSSLAEKPCSPKRHCSRSSVNTEPSTTTAPLTPQRAG